MQTRLQFSKEPIFRSYSSHYGARAQITPSQTAELFRVIIDRVMPPLINSEQLMLDAKGLDGNSSLQPELETTPGRTADELLFVQGSITEDEGEEHKEEDDDGPNRESFSIVLLTEFYDSPTFRSIRYRVKEKRIGVLPQAITLRNLSSTPTVELEQFRAGLGFFSARSVFSLFGLFPSVCDELLIECSKGEFALQINAESLRRRSQFPLEENTAVRNLADSIQLVFQFDILDDYRKQARK